MSVLSRIELPQMQRLTVAQGDSVASGDPNLMYTTVLGSCIAVCLYDSAAKVGGMNHFLLADPAPLASEEAHLLNRYGLHSMELLINAMLQRGCTRWALKARVYGGATMREGLGDIGRRNIVFAREFLANEKIPILGEDVGGVSARRIDFRPAAGLSRCKVVDVTPPEKIIIKPPPSVGDVELF